MRGRGISRGSQKNQDSIVSIVSCGLETHRGPMAWASVSKRQRICKDLSRGIVSSCTMYVILLVWWDLSLKSSRDPKIFLSSKTFRIKIKSQDRGWKHRTMGRVIALYSVNLGSILYSLYGPARNYSCVHSQELVLSTSGCGVLPK